MRNLYEKYRFYVTSTVTINEPKYILMPLNASQSSTLKICFSYRGKHRHVVFAFDQML